MKIIRIPAILLTITVIAILLIQAKMLKAPTQESAVIVNDKHALLLLKTLEAPSQETYLTALAAMQNQYDTTLMVQYLEQAKNYCLQEERALANQEMRNWSEEKKTTAMALRESFLNDAIDSLRKLAKIAKIRKDLETEQIYLLELQDIHRKLQLLIAIN